MLSFRQRAVSEAELRDMNLCLKHRGPDDRGVYAHGPVGLGHTRLSIIDLSPAGHQPMSNEDGTVWIVFNGEIYNHQELRPALEEAGHRFVGTSDTQVIIHAYEQYGIEGCLERLRGMFAFAIWDRRKQLLVLARDRVGKKPLKYYLDPEGLIFASELKAILANPRARVSVDYAAIDLYLNHLFVPTPFTGFAEIRKLPPAHYLTCTPAGEMHVRRYWDLRYRPDRGRTRAEWKERILHELDEAVRLRMIADVPVGAFLSGGVDSSAVVASMALQSGKPIKTFSVGFGDPLMSELPYARQVAERYRTDHTEIMVEPKGLELLDKLVYHFEEPYADSSAIPTYSVAEATRRHVTVALNGDGGDEAFAGYAYFQHLHRARWLEPFRPLLGWASYPAAWLYRTRPGRLARKGATFLESYRHSRAGRELPWLSNFSLVERECLYHPDFPAPRQRSPAWDVARSASALAPIDRALYTLINTILPDDFLVKVDIASMAVSLEARSPLLDHRFQEFCATIPAELKVTRGEGKAIFKEALEGRLPRGVMYRRKRGFSIPIHRWFREEWRQRAREILLDPATLDRKLFRRETLERMLAEHERGAILHGQRIWALITLELWFRQFVDRRPVRAAA